MDKMNEIYINEYFTRSVVADRSKNPELEGHHEPIIVESVVKTDDLFEKQLPPILGFQTDILPSKCKFLKVLEDGSKVLVVEDEPKVRTITFDYSPETDLEFLKQNGKYELFGLENFPRTSPFKLTLSFPYIIYLIYLTKRNTYKSLHLYFRLSPLTSLNDYLLIPNLPNVGESCNVCLGYEGRGKSYSLNTIVETVINNFWFNKFNHDYSTNCDLYQEIPEVCDFFTWAYNTKIDPFFIFSVKWIPCNKKYKFLKNAINVFKPEGSQPSIIDSLKKLIKATPVATDDDDYFGHESRNMTDSILIRGETHEKNIILSIGDELIHNNIHYCVNSFVHDGFDDIKVILVDDDDVPLEIDLVDDDHHGLDLSEVFKDFQVVNPTSLEINGETINVGDLIFFKDLDNVKIVEKIIKTKDNLYQVKIGRYFYLDNTFLKDNVQKVDYLKINGVEVKKDKILHLLSLSFSTTYYFPMEQVKFNLFRSEKGDILLNFTSLQDSEEIEINTQAPDYHLVSEETTKLSQPDVFRINNRLYTNYPHGSKDRKLTLIEGIGIGYTSSVEIDDELRRDRKVIEKYLQNVIQNNINSITIPSCERSSTYTIGDAVIYINWTNPEGMLQIRKINKFSIEKDIFSFELIGEDNSIINVPMMDLDTGLCFFERIRHVCSEINNLKVGTRVKAKNRNIADFPMKDWNEIKAFVIDDIQPMVLFSNCRTVLLKNVTEENFEFVTPVDKKYQKITLAKLNIEKLKIQDGDMFFDSDTDRIIMFLYYSAYPSRTFFMRFKESPSVSKIYLDTYHPSWQSDMVSNQNRIGLLLPRYTTEQLKTLELRKGIPTIFGDIYKPLTSKLHFGIRREWK